MFDTHSHLNFQDFAKDYAQVIRRSFDYGLKGIINVGSDFADSQRAIEIASQYKKGVYAAIGLHPIHIEQEKFDFEAYKKLTENDKVILSDSKESSRAIGRSEGSRHNKVVAIGETGLDYYRFKITDLRFKKDDLRFKKEDLGFKKDEIQKMKLLQKKIFVEHLRLARELDLPLILHCRGEKDNPLEAYKEMLEILSRSDADPQRRSDADQRRAFLDSPEVPSFSPRSPEKSSPREMPRRGRRGGAKRRGVIHCFQADQKTAEEFIKLGFYIGFTGLITFPNINQELLEVVKEVPLDRILLETDCPFLAPASYRDQRCEPWQVKFTAQKIAEIKNLPFEEVVEATTKNAVELFGLEL